MAGMDFLIQGGKVVDGTGSPWRYADVAVQDGQIVDIGRNIKPGAAARVIDAQDKVVCPGFVDAHSHADITLLAGEWVEHRIMQGITTEVVGQDGLSYAPVSPEHRAEWRRYLRGLNGVFHDRVPWNWESTDDLLAAYEGKAANIVHLIPHGAVRVQVMGWADRPAGPGEISQMQELVRQSLEEGGAGLSTGLTYIPCSHATTEEMIALCKPVGEVGGVLAIHLRSYARDLMPAMKEAARIGRESGSAVQVSHLRMADQSTWGMSGEILDFIERTRREGVDLTYDIYPYTKGCAPLFCLLPPWAQSKGPDLMIERLKDPVIRDQMTREMDSWNLDWSVYSLSNVSGEDFGGWIGTPFPEAARERGTELFDFIFDVLLESELDATIIAGGGSEQDNRVMLQGDSGMIGSDGVLIGAQPHPRGYGTYPKLLTEYVRDQGILTLEEAVHKMSAMPARRHGLEDRGVLSVGSAADILVFDLDGLQDHATYQQPRRLPEGMHFVLINGRLAVDGGRYIGSTYGRALRPLGRD